MLADILVIVNECQYFAVGLCNAPIACMADAWILFGKIAHGGVRSIESDPVDDVQGGLVFVIVHDNELNLPAWWRIRVDQACQGTAYALRSAKCADAD